MVAVALRYEDDSVNPIATVTAVAITASDVDVIDETADIEGGEDPARRFYIEATCAGVDSARSVVFSGDFTWDNWIAPEEGAWTFTLRNVDGDGSVATTSKTFDAP